ncbi:hypothetical protein D9V80_01665 [Buchnera aphidicola (Thelaxes californica)]|uniref:Thiol:disulfide interchange protein n=1 Tax=Buchnera aphidicola (Thelaxes californica) TaxID=1315998 RepID=A0A4D6YP25_9GAMM|nr:DsbA family protein [Buchnera aphidicola]QCI26855.1 hypothetical protein D9V80_01665 [Buchnera aphidicola (Thelaxes californica)]
MKKFFLIVFICIFFYQHAMCQEMEKENNVIFLQQKKINNNSIKIFFSFFCPHCYILETNDILNEILENAKKNKIQIQYYHIDFNKSKLGLMLNKAWIIAKLLHIQEKIKKPIFLGIQELNTIYDYATLKKVFIESAHISSEIYDSYWNSITVEILIKKNEQEIKNLPITDIPAILIYEKYLINFPFQSYIIKSDLLNQYFRQINSIIKKSIIN